ncbi:MAG: hypothetical protein FWG38_01640 [Defluviitaleaceae bacterium]|nr:hypothetical protein [Defluviitaleaceae bacterium]
MTAEKYVQVGSFALRNPKGEFLPSVPLFIRKTDAGQVNEATGRTVAEEITMADVSKIFADKHRQYVQGLAEAGVK